VLQGSSYKVYEEHNSAGVVNLEDTWTTVSTLPLDPKHGITHGWLCFRLRQALIPQPGTVIPKPYTLNPNPAALMQVNTGVNPSAAECPAGAM
jgi:hypothetical protein